jgi:Signal transducing histidine kinase, homodimeric domain
LRDGKRELTPALVSLILETVDATRKVLASIETSGKEGAERFEDLTERLRIAAQLTAGEEAQSAPELSGAGTAPGLAMEPVAEKASFPPHEEGPAEKEEERGRKKEAGKEEDVARSSAAVDANIRVGVGLLDKLMDLVGELVLTRNQILQFNIEREDPALNATSQRLNLITTELQEGVMKTRMQPIGMVWVRKYRVMMVGGQLFPLHLAISKQWKVHYFSADMRDRPEHREEEANFLADMPGVIGAKAMAALDRLSAAMRLDYGGIDFALNQRGEILLFEANATMVVEQPDGDPRWDYRRAAVNRIHAAVRHLLLDGAGVLPRPFACLDPP